MKPEDGTADRARLARIELQLASDDRFSRLQADVAAIFATLAERKSAETEAAEAIQRKLEETAKAAADALKSALTSANDIELERVGRVHDRIGATEEAAKVALTAATAANKTAEANAKEMLDQHNGLLDKMSAKDASYQTKTEAMVQQRSTDDKIGANKQVVDDKISEIRDDLGQIRTNIAVGPPDLQVLQARADRSAGVQEGAADQRTERRAVTTVQLAAWMVGATFLYTLIAVIGIMAASGTFK